VSILLSKRLKLNEGLVVRKRPGIELHDNRRVQGVQRVEVILVKPLSVFNSGIHSFSDIKHISIGIKSALTDIAAV
jgi:hypothetical protein